jgi:hypothetical protein
MRNPDVIQRAQRPVRMAAHAGRWLLPWRCALLASASLAEAVNLALGSGRAVQAVEASDRLLWGSPAPGVPECPEPECPATSAGR